MLSTRAPLRALLAASLVAALAGSPAPAVAQVEPEPEPIYPAVPVPPPPPPRPRPPRPPPPAAPRARAAGEHVRNPWYIGFGIGSGAGGLTYAGETRSFSRYLEDYHAAYDPVSIALQFEVGATLRPDLLLGFDLRGLRTQSSSGLDAAVQATDYLAMLTWYPSREGFFVRGGLGLATLSLDVQERGYSVTDTVGGLGLLGGVGYAFWLGKRFNLTLNADVSAQLFTDSVERPTGSRFFDIYLGFGWY